MKKIIIIILSLSSILSYAQNIDFGTEFINNPYLYNPARAGSFYHFSGDTEKGTEVNSSFSNYWIGSQTTGTQFYVSGNSTFPQILSKKDSSHSKIGIGGVIFNDRISIFQKTGFSLSYAYRIKIGKYNNLNLGLNTSYLNQSINTSNANIKHDGDMALAQNSWNGNYFNIGSGLNYRFKKDLNKFIVDFSVNNLLNTVKYNENIDQDNFLYRNHGGISPTFFYGLEYGHTFKFKANDKDETKYTTEYCNAKFVELADEKLAAYRDSLKLTGMETNQATKETIKMIEGQTEESKRTIENTLYNLNPYLNINHNLNSLVEIHFGISNSLQLKSLPSVKFLFGIGSQFQTTAPDSGLEGIGISLNPFLGAKINDRFTFIGSVNNNINTYMRHNDATRMNISVKYNFYK